MDEANSDDSFGTSVSVDQNLIAVGSFNIDTTYVYERQNGSWILMAKLSGNDTEDGDRFSSSVSVDNSTVVTGASSDDFLGRTASGAVYAFETEVQTPFLTIPSNEEMNVSQNPMFSWEVALGANNYHFQLALDQDFSSIVANRDMLSSNSVQIDNLDKERTFYWRVRSIHTSRTLGWSSQWSNIYSFTTESELRNPILIEPTDNKYEEGTDIQLCWDEQNPSTSYRLQIDDNNIFTSPTSEIGLTDTCFFFEI